MKEYRNETFNKTYIILSLYPQLQDTKIQGVNNIQADATFLFLKENYTISEHDLSIVKVNILFVEYFIPVEIKPMP